MEDDPPIHPVTRVDLPKLATTGKYGNPYWIWVVTRPFPPRGGHPAPDPITAIMMANQCESAHSSVTACNHWIPQSQLPTYQGSRKFDPSGNYRLTTGSHLRALMTDEYSRLFLHIKLDLIYMSMTFFIDLISNQY